MSHFRLIFEMLDFFDLEEVEFEGGFAAEHGDHDAHFAASHVDHVDFALLAFERAVDDADNVALGHVDREFRFSDADALHEGFDFFGGDWRWRGAGTNEAGDVWRVADNVPAVVSDGHFDQDVAREDFFFGDFALAVFDFDFLFLGHEDIENFLAHVHGFDALFQAIEHGFFETGVGVDSVPAAAVIGGLLGHNG